MLKITDTTSRHSRAEDNLIFDPGFLLFIRGKYSIKDIKAVDPIKIQDKFKLKGFTFGNFVTQAERYFFVYKIEKQLELLAKLKGSNNLGFGKLIIGFGAHGKGGSLAHFNPSTLFINLNRGRKLDYKGILQGENSFVHQYGHYIDFLQGRKEKFYQNFASEGLTIDYKTRKPILRGSAKAQTFQKFTAIGTSNLNYMKGLLDYTNATYLRSNIEVLARLFEATISRIAHTTHKDYQRFFDDQYSGKWYLSHDQIDKSNAKTLAKQMLKV